MAENDPQKWWATMFQMQFMSRRNINDYYSFAIIPADTA